MAYILHILTNLVSQPPDEVCISLSPFIRGGNQGRQNLSDLPRVTHLVCDAARIQSQCCLALHAATFNKASTVCLDFTHIISFTLYNPMR